MTDRVECADCGEPLVDDETARDLSTRTPCPKCGSKARKVFTSGVVYASSFATGHAEALTYPRKLIQDAQTMVSNDHLGVAVVVVHMACELAVERRLAEAFKARGIPDLQEPVYDLLSGYNLANERIRRLYVALTGDDIQNQPFWVAFKESAKRRNNVVHRGELVTADQAQSSIDSGKSFVSHMGLW